jgi:solute carrier family 35 (UDP-sugar transporter), member A1/2/3
VRCDVRRASRAYIKLCSPHQLMASTSNINLATFRINIDTSELHDDEDDDELQINTNPTVPSACGIPLKYISYALKLSHLPVSSLTLTSLVTLAIQNSLLTIIMHYSRVSIPEAEAYMPATAVLLNEILKGSISFVIALLRIEAPPQQPAPFTPITQQPSWPDTLRLERLRRLSREVFSSDCWKLSIPAILYGELYFRAISTN